MADPYRFDPLQFAVDQATQEPPARRPPGGFGDVVSALWRSLPENVRNVYGSVPSAVAELSPGAGVRDMVQASGDLSRNVVEGNPWGATNALGGMALGALGAVPGMRAPAAVAREASGVGRVAQALADAPTPGMGHNMGPPMTPEVLALTRERSAALTDAIRARLQQEGWAVGDPAASGISASTYIAAKPPRELQNLTKRQRSPILQEFGLTGNPQDAMGFRFRVSDHGNVSSGPVGLNIRADKFDDTAALSQVDDFLRTWRLAHQTPAAPNAPVSDWWAAVQAARQKP